MCDRRGRVGLCPRTRCDPRFREGNCASPQRGHHRRTDAWKLVGAPAEPSYPRNGAQAQLRVAPDGLVRASAPCQAETEEPLSGIDLFAVEPRAGDDYYIESGVSVSGSYSKIWNQVKPFLASWVSRCHAAPQADLAIMGDLTECEPPDASRLPGEHTWIAGRFFLVR